MPQSPRFRRVCTLGSSSLCLSVVLAVGVDGFRDWSFQRYRERVGDTDSEAARSWRPTSEHFNPQPMVQRQPVVTDFQLLSVEEADEHFGNSELVLGITVNGESRAYPVNVMTGPKREIFNDALGGRPIAATW